MQCNATYLGRMSPRTNLKMEVILSDISVKLCHSSFLYLPDDNTLQVLRKHEMDSGKIYCILQGLQLKYETRYR